MDSKECQKSTGLLTDREWGLCIIWEDEKGSLLSDWEKIYEYIKGAWESGHCQVGCGAVNCLITTDESWDAMTEAVEH